MFDLRFRNKSFSVSDKQWLGQLDGVPPDRPDEPDARFQLEKLEFRCLLSGISSIAEFSLPSSPATISAITTGPDGYLWFTDRGGNAIGIINPNTHAVSLFTFQCQCVALWHRRRSGRQSLVHREEHEQDRRD